MYQVIPGKGTYSVYFNIITILIFVYFSSDHFLESLQINISRHAKISFNFSKESKSAFMYKILC
jgi:hypothetical protein